MQGIDLTPLYQVAQLFIDQIALLLKMINFAVALVGLTATELSKDLLPDNIEKKWMRIIGVVVCCLLAIIPSFECSIVSAMVTGCLVVGGYAFLFKFVQSIIESIFKFKNGNGDSKVIAPPVPEVKK